LLYVDQPVGTGFSYANSDYVTGETQVAIDVYTFLEGWFTENPNFAFSILLSRKTITVVGPDSSKEIVPTAMDFGSLQKKYKGFLIFAVMHSNSQTQIEFGQLPKHIKAIRDYLEWNEELVDYFELKTPLSSSSSTSSLTSTFTFSSPITSNVEVLVGSEPYVIPVSNVKSWVEFYNMLSADISEGKFNSNKHHVIDSNSVHIMKNCLFGISLFKPPFQVVTNTIEIKFGNECVVTPFTETTTCQALVEQIADDIGLDMEKTYKMVTDNGTHTFENTNNFCHQLALHPCSFICLKEEIIVNEITLNVTVGEGTTTVCLPKSVLTDNATVGQVIEIMIQQLHLSGKFRIKFDGKVQAKSLIFRDVFDEQNPPKNILLLV